MVKKRGRYQGTRRVYGESTHRKKFKKDRKEWKNRTVVCYTPSICPDIMRVCLPYFQRGNVAGTGITDIVFRGNSCFDPDFTGVGAQPIGFDVWAGFYRRYRVIGSHITVYANSLDAADALAMFVVPLNTNTALTSPEQLCEQQDAKKMILGLQTGDSRYVLTHYMETSKMMGIAKNAYRNEFELSAPIGNNPTREWYWHCGLFDVSSLLDLQNADFMFEVKYYVEFFDKETLVRS